MASFGLPWNMPQSMRMRARSVTSRNWEPVTVVAPPRKRISIRAVSQDGCGGAAGATLGEAATTSHWKRAIIRPARGGRRHVRPLRLERPDDELVDEPRRDWVEIGRASCRERV